MYIYVARPHIRCYVIALSDITLNEHSRLQYNYNNYNNTPVLCTALPATFLSLDFRDDCIKNDETYSHGLCAFDYVCVCCITASDMNVCACVWTNV